MLLTVTLEDGRTFQVEGRTQRFSTYSPSRDTYNYMLAGVLAKFTTGFDYMLSEEYVKDGAHHEVLTKILSITKADV